MKQTVEGVEKDFVVGLDLEFLRAVVRDGGANENLAIGKRDDIGLGRIVHELAVDACDGGAIDQDDVNFSEVGRQRAGQQRQRRLKPRPKRTYPDRRFALLV